MAATYYVDVKHTVKRHPHNLLMRFPGAKCSRLWIIGRARQKQGAAETCQHSTFICTVHVK